MFFFFLNGSECRQKLIGTIIRVLVRHLHASNNDKDPYEISVTSEPSVCGGGGPDGIGRKWVGVSIPQPKVAKFVSWIACIICTIMIVVI